MTGSDTWDTCRLFLFVGNVKGLLFLRVLCCDGGSEVNLASLLPRVRKTQAAGNYRFEGTTLPPSRLVTLSSAPGEERRRRRRVGLSLAALLCGRR